jgi:RHS repeat-associated protein
MVMAYIGNSIQENWTFENHGSQSKKNTIEYSYDNYGNILSEIDEADDSTSDDDTDLRIIYLYDTNRYIVGKPEEVKVIDDDGNVLRNRRAVYDNKGNLEKFSTYIDTTNSWAETSLIYDEFGNIQKLTDPNDYFIRYIYDDETHSFIVSVNDSFGYNSRSQYDKRFGVVTKATDLNKNEINYEYDKFGRMKKVWGPYLSTSDKPDLEMTYDIAQIPASAITKNREDYIATNTNTIDTVIFIDGLKRVIQTKKTSEVYNSSTKQSSVGMVTTGRVKFDDSGRIIKQGQPVFESENYTYNAAIQMKNPTTFTYDDKGRTLTVETPADTDSKVSVYRTITSYIIEDDLIKTTVQDPEGKEKESYADMYGKIIKIHEFNKNKTIETLYEYNAVGEILSVIDADDNSTSIGYDTAGRRTFIENPDSGRTQFFYDLAGNLTRKIDSKGNEVNYEYEYNRLLKIDYPDVTTKDCETMKAHQLNADCDTIDVLYEYGGTDSAERSNNQTGRITKITDASGQTEMFYGKLGETKRTEKYLPLTSGESAIFTTTQRYDSFGRMKELTYPDGEMLYYEYDRGGLLKKAYSTQNNRNNQYLNNIAYDEFGQRAELFLANGIKVNYEYDPGTRRLKSLTSKNNRNEFLQKITYTYDKVGNIKTMDDDVREYVHQAFSYDDLYRLMSAAGEHKNYNGQSSSDYKLYKFRRNYGYDNIHNMISKVAVGTITMPDNTIESPKDQNFIYTYRYNGNKPHAVSSVVAEYSQNDQIETTHYDYDDNGSLISRTKSTGANKERDLYWDSENRLTAVIDQSDVITKFTYNASGERIRKNGIHGETIYVNQFFSLRNDLIASKHYFAGNSRLATKLVQVGERVKDYVVPAEPQSEVTTVLDTSGNTTSSNAANNNANENGNRYGQTKNANGNNSSANDNDKADKGNKGKGYAYGKYKEHTNSGQGKNTNVNANEREKQNANAQQNKGKGNNSKAKGNDGNSGNQNNNGNKSNNNKNNGKNGKDYGKLKGNQGKGNANGHARKEVQISNVTVTENNGLGPVKAQGNAYAWGFYKDKFGNKKGSGASGRPTANSTGRGSGIFKGQDEQLFFYLTDHLGSTSYITDPAGVVKEKTLYYPYGEIWLDDGIMEGHDLLGYKFTGKELDEETGLMYFGARYYDPKINMWISTDPALGEYLPTGAQLFFPEEAFNANSLKGSGGVFNSHNLNLYQYAGLNPIKNIDPDGRVEYPASQYVYSISSQPGERTNAITNQGTEMHRGVDQRTPEGTPLVAMRAGTVYSVGTQVDSNGKETGYGNYVIIDHGEIDGKHQFSITAHLSGALVKPGQKVKEGEFIGLSGNSGRSSGPHVHSEVFSIPGGDFEKASKDWKSMERMDHKDASKNDTMHWGDGTLSDKLIENKMGFE